MTSDAWDVLDWRRRVAELYRRVRGASEPAAAHRLWVAGRDELLRRHPASPVPPAARDGYPGADVAAYDPAYRFVVSVDGAVEPERREVTTGTDGTVPMDRVGRVVLPGIGELDVWWLGSYGGGIFLPVRDVSSASYGGGRYLLDTTKGADLGGNADALVVDLNFAYQPSCAYDEAWACPLPGPTNRVGVALPVGERYRP
ncbi:MAG: DUF1684 domain-containing protein [Nocardioidaceae bacterium]